MDGKRKAPEVRFRGFSGEWEELFLGNVSDIKTGPFGSTLHADDYVKDGEPIITTEHFKLGDLPNNKEGIPQVCENDYSRLKAYLLKSGDIVFSRVGSIDINAHVKRNHNGWLFSGRVLRVRTTETVDSEYLHHELFTSRVRKSVISRAVGQTMPSINTEILRNTPIQLPKNSIEQSRIGTFFQHLDQLITLHQKKYHKLTNIKKAMLEKMFPKNGADVPEIRFEGFEGKWEERKLGEITNSYSGGTPSVGINEYYNGNIPFIRSAEINSSSTELFLTEVGLNNSSAKIVHKGNVLYALYGATSGEVGRSKITGAINQAILAIIPKNNENSEFIAQWLRKQKNDILGKYLQGGQGNLSGTIVKDLIIPIPCPNEQKKIGTYFQSLDQLITLQQTRIVKLKNIKKACLEKMFV